MPRIPEAEIERIKRETDLVARPSFPRQASGVRQAAAKMRYAHARRRDRLPLVAEEKSPQSSILAEAAEKNAP